MLACRFPVILWLFLLVDATQSGIAQQNFGVVQGRIAEGIKQVDVLGSIAKKKVGTSIALTVPVSVNGSKTSTKVRGNGVHLCANERHL